MNQQNGGQRVGCNNNCRQGRACDCLPIQYADEESDRAVWDWITDMTPTKADLAKFAAIVALLVLGTTVLIGATS